MALWSGPLFALASLYPALWPIAWIAMVPLALAIRAATPKRAFLLGWLSGSIGFGVAACWLTGILHDYGSLPWAASLLVTALACAWYGLTWGIAALFARVTRPGLGFTAGLTALAVLERFFPTPFPFPWQLSVTQATVLPVAQVAELGGTTAVAALVLMGNGALADALCERPWPLKRLAAAGLVVAACVGFGIARVHAVEAQLRQAPRLRVGLVQSNDGWGREARAPQQAPRRLARLQASSAALQARGAELVVWPESAYPYEYSATQSLDFEDERSAMQGFSAPLVLNAATGGKAVDEHFNSALLITADRRVRGMYHKIRLVSFGETVPTASWWPRAWWRRLPRRLRWTAGREVRRFDVGPWRLGPLVCIEDLCPDLCRQQVDRGAQALLAVMNEAWFGGAVGPREHLLESTYRAIETRRCLIRSGNTGASGLVDATGRVVEATPIDAVGAPVRDVLLDVPMLDGRGPYLVLGDAFAYVLAGWLLYRLIRSPIPY